jgi:hypothetical protein
MAARASVECLGVGLHSRQLAPAALRYANAAKRQVAIAVRIECGQALQKCYHRPYFVVSLGRDPSRHAGVFETVLDDPEQLTFRPGPHRCVQIGGRW